CHRGECEAIQAEVRRFVARYFANDLGYAWSAGAKRNDRSRFTTEDRVNLIESSNHRIIESFQDRWFRPSMIQSLNDSILMTHSSDHPIPPPAHSIKVLIAAYSRLALWTAPAWFTDRLRTDFPQLNITQITSGDRLSQELSDATVLFGGSFGPEDLRE